MKAINQKYWLGEQNPTQRAAARPLPALGMGMPSLDLPSVHALAAALSAAIPSWILLIMIMLGTLGTASAVIVRMRNELHLSTQQYERTALEIDMLRRGNAALGTEIGRMRNDPTMIESVARARLGMVRPNDIVVPAETEGLSNLATLSLTR